MRVTDGARKAPGLVKRGLLGLLDNVTLLRLTLEHLCLFTWIGPSLL